MTEHTINLTLHQIIKRLLVVVIGSGLLSNALYIYGLAYYQGYIETLGFNTTFFPINIGESLLWTYNASRELGAATVNIWTKLTGQTVIVLMLTIYMLARVWMAINEQEGVRKKNLIRSTYCVSRLLVKLRNNHRIIFKTRIQLVSATH